MILTAEQKKLPITWERIREYHYTVGEDFFDQGNDGNGYIFSGWLIAKYPQHFEALCAISNDAGFSICAYDYDDILGEDMEKDIQVVYIEYADFCNHTVALLEEMNQVLLETVELYNQIT